MRPLLAESGLFAEERSGALDDLAGKLNPVYWAAAGFKDTLLRCSMKREMSYGYEKAI